MKTSHWMVTLVGVGAAAAACSVKHISSTGATQSTSSGAGVGGATGSNSVAVGPGPGSTKSSALASNNVAATTGVGGGSNMGCYTAMNAAHFQKLPAQTAQQSVCKGSDITNFFSSCFMKNGGTMAKCQAFQMNNAVCDGCIEGSKDLMYNPALVGFPTPDMKFEDLANFMACESLAEMHPECGVPLTALLVCQFSACQTCAPMDQAGFDACFKAAEADACKTEAGNVTADCQKVNLNMLDPKCNGMDFFSIAQNVITYMCNANNTP